MRSSRLSWPNQSPYSNFRNPIGGIGADNAEELIQIRILTYRDIYFQVGKSLLSKDLVAVLLSLVQNLDIFAWSPYDLPGVDLNFITYRLNVNLLFLPKKRKPRRSAKQHVEAMKEEVEKLKQVGAIKKAFFLEWLSNIVVVRNNNGK